MQLRFQLDDILLDLSARKTIEKRIRIMIGLHTNDVRSVQILLSNPPDAPDRVHCRMAILFVDKARVVFEEEESDIEQAVQWALWRLHYAVGRHSLRIPSP